MMAFLDSNAITVSSAFEHPATDDADEVVLNPIVQLILIRLISTLTTLNMTLALS